MWLCSCTEVCIHSHKVYTKRIKCIYIHAHTLKCTHTHTLINARGSLKNIRASRTLKTSPFALINSRYFEMHSRRTYRTVSLVSQQVGVACAHTYRQRINHFGNFSHSGEDLLPLFHLQEESLTSQRPAGQRLPFPAVDCYSFNASAACYAFHDSSRQLELNLHVLCLKL